MKKLIFIISCLFLFAFKTGNDNKSQYQVPYAAYSVTAGDIDMDGDNDIIIGHNYCTQNQWSGVSFMLNNGDGTFFLNDSIFLYSWQTNIYAVNLNSSPFPEIIARHYENETQYMAILKYEDGDYIINLNIMQYGISGNSIGDINGDGFFDVVVYNNNDQFWGVLYNDGTGNFSEPDYTYVDYYPLDITCGDLNDDNWDDIVVCGQSTEVYFSYPEGFELLPLEPTERVSTVDFDLDGDRDILTFVGFAGSTYLQMYENKGNNIFETLEQFIFQPNSSKFFVCDFNNDTLQDILFQLFDKSGYIIYYNQGSLELGDPQFVSLPFSGEGLRNCYCADMDGNGYNDIITVKTLYVYLPDNLEILFNDGHGNFGEDPISEIPILKLRDKILNNKLKCYPNPFRDKTTFEINTEQPAGIELFIYNMQGKLITTLSNKIEKQQNYHIVWNGSDETGKTCNSGTYIVVLMVNEKPVQSIRIIKH